MARSIEMTEEQFHGAIAAAAKAAAEAVLAAHGPQVPVQKFEDAAPDDQFHAMMRERRGQHLPPLEVKTKSCKSHVTGATFDADVDHNGIVTSLPNYKYPEGIDQSVDSGGLVPHGLPMKDETSGREHKLYSQWRWENFWQLDLRTYVGKKLPKFAQIEFSETLTKAAE